MSLPVIAMLGSCGGNDRSANQQVAADKVANQLENAAAQSGPTAAVVLKNQANEIAQEQSVEPAAEPGSAAQQALSEAGKAQEAVGEAPAEGPKPVTPPGYVRPTAPPTRLAGTVPENRTGLRYRPLPAFPGGADFLKYALAENLTQVELGTIASLRATDPRLRTFGAKIMADHRKLHARMVRLANKRDIGKPLSMTPASIARRNKLALLQGKAYDRQLLSDIISSEQRAIRYYTVEAHDQADRKFSEVAQSSLPMLRDHLKHAERLRQNLH